MAGSYRGDPTLEPVDILQGRNPITGGSIPIPLQRGVKWIRHSKGTVLPFYWQNGQNVCQGLDKIMLAKVKELAERLWAVCLEEEG